MVVSAAACGGLVLRFGEGVFYDEPGFLQQFESVVDCGEAYALRPLHQGVERTGCEVRVETHDFLQYHAPFGTLPDAVLTDVCVQLLYSGYDVFFCRCHVAVPCCFLCGALCAPVSRHAVYAAVISARVVTRVFEYALRIVVMHQLQRGYFLMVAHVCLNDFPSYECASARGALLCERQGERPVVDVLVAPDDILSEEVASAYERGPHIRLVVHGPLPLLVGVAHQCLFVSVGEEQSEHVHCLAVIYDVVNQAARGGVVLLPHGEFGREPYGHEVRHYLFGTHVEFLIAVYHGEVVDGIVAAHVVVFAQRHESIADYDALVETGNVHIDVGDAVVREEVSGTAERQCKLFFK